MSTAPRATGEKRPVGGRAGAGRWRMLQNMEVLAMVAVFLGLAFVAALLLRALLVLSGSGSGEQSPQRCHHDP